MSSDVQEDVDTIWASPLPLLFSQVDLDRHLAHLVAHTSERSGCRISLSCGILCLHFCLLSCCPISCIPWSCHVT